MSSPCGHLVDVYYDFGGVITYLVYLCIYFINIVFDLLPLKMKNIFSISQRQ